MKTLTTLYKYYIETWKSLWNTLKNLFPTWEELKSDKFLKQYSELLTAMTIMFLILLGLCLLIGKWKLYIALGIFWLITFIGVTLLCLYELGD